MRRHGREHGDGFRRGGQRDVCLRHDLAHERLLHLFQLRYDLRRAQHALSALRKHDDLGQLTADALRSQYFAAGRIVPVRGTFKYHAGKKGCFLQKPGFPEHKKTRPDAKNIGARRLFWIIRGRIRRGCTSQAALRAAKTAGKGRQDRL